MSEWDIEADRQVWFARFGEFIVWWNKAEFELRVLLMRAAGGTLEVQFLVSEMGSVALGNGLRTMSQTLGGEKQSSFLHVVDFYERLREYRNYYAHGVIGLTHRNRDRKCVGILHMASAKGKFRTATEFVLEDSLTAIRDYAHSLYDAVFTLTDVLYPAPGAFADQVLPSPDKFPLPERLRKTLHYPQIAPHEHQSSLRSG